MEVGPGGVAGERGASLLLTFCAWPKVMGTVAHGRQESGRAAGMIAVAQGGRMANESS